MDNSAASVDPSTTASTSTTSASHLSGPSAPVSDPLALCNTLMSSFFGEMKSFMTDLVQEIRRPNISSAAGSAAQLAAGTPINPVIPPVHPTVIPAAAGSSAQLAAGTPPIAGVQPLPGLTDASNSRAAAGGLPNGQEANVGNLSASDSILNSPVQNIISSGTPSTDTHPLVRDRRGAMLTKARPLHYGLSSKLKSHIWDDKFVDFSTLLTSEPDQHSTVLSTNDDEVITLSIKSHSKRQPLSIIRWQQAFDIFSCVYTQKYPDQSQGLLQYSALIKEIYSDGGDWLFYDENFRKWREEEPALDWNDINHSILFKASLRSRSIPPPPAGGPSFKKRKNQTFRPKRYSGNGLALPPGTCWPFHRNGTCSGGASCRFSHKCQRCEGIHPTAFCKSNSHDSTPKPQSSLKSDISKPTKASNSEAPSTARPTTGGK